MSNVCVTMNWKNELQECLQEMSLTKFLSDKDWEHLSQLADRMCDGFTRRLTERFPSLTPADLQLCLLMRLHFTNAQVDAVIGEC